MSVHARLHSPLRIPGSTSSQATSSGCNIHCSATQACCQAYLYLVTTRPRACSSSISASVSSLATNASSDCLPVFACTCALPLAECGQGKGGGCTTIQEVPTVQVRLA
eukprot:1134250-Pelagomonas_calceolata.AAC.5